MANSRPVTSSDAVFNSKGPEPDMVLAQSNEREYDYGGLINTGAEAATAHCAIAPI